MFFIPGFLISIVTFPGVIVHEFAHQLFCRLARVAIFDVCYFRVGNPAGYVVHEIPKKSYQNILIGIGPFFVNTIIGALIALPAAIPVIKFGSGSVIDYLLIYLGVSIAMHSFPSTGDAKSIWNSLKENDTNIIVRIIAAPIVGLIFLCAAGSIIWLDLFYGVTVAMFLPNLIIGLLA
jgi:hypothetical protein